MINHIPDLPEIPDELKANFIGRGIVPFVGAGLSRIQGCPDWNGFADAVLDQLRSNDMISHAQINQLSDLGPRVKLSIARQIEEKNETNIIDYADIFYQEPSHKNLQLNRALDQISKIIVTTNYDNLLEHLPPDDFDIKGDSNFDSDKILSRKRLHSLDEFSSSSLDFSNDERSVFHIHGSIKDPTNMIISTVII